MADYGVGGDDWEPLPWSWAVERLVPCRNYWVVTVSGSGRPHSMPVWGVWDADESRFSFTCAPSARKARNVAENPRVVVTTENTVECVSVEGMAAVVPPGERMEWWIERYLPKYQPLSPGYSGDFLREAHMIEVTPEKAFGMIETEEDFARRATRWTFDPS